LPALEQESHEVKGDPDLKRTGPAGQLEELLARICQTFGVGNRSFVVSHSATIDKSRGSRDWR
jgi:hypothetical protein